MIIGSKVQYGAMDQEKEESKELNLDVHNSGERSVEELFDDLGLGRAQFFSWIALMSVCLYNVSELNTTFIIIKYIRCEWNLGFFFELAFTASVSFFFASGGLVFGMLSDHFGRRRVILMTVPMYIVATLLSSLSLNKWMFLVTKAAASFFVGSNYPVGTVFSAEITSSKFKGNGIFLASITSSIGSLLVALLAFFFLNNVGWRWFVVILTCPAFLSIVAVFYLPESPRFLAVSGRNEEALQAMERFYFWNNRPFPINTRLVKYKNVIRGNIRDLLKPKYRKETILLTVMYIGNFYIYFGLIAYLPFALNDRICGLHSHFTTLVTHKNACKTLTQDDLGELFMITSASTMAVLAGFFSAKRLGRNIPMKVAGFLSFAFTLTLLFCVNLPFTGSVYFIIKFLSSVYNFIVSVIMLEIYPTVVRNTAAGFINFWGKSSGALSTVLVHSLYQISPLSVVIFFILAALVSMVMGCLWTKETKDAVYEEIIEECE